MSKFALKTSVPPCSNVIPKEYLEQAKDYNPWISHDDDDDDGDNDDDDNELHETNIMDKFSIIFILILALLTMIIIIKLTN